MTPNDEVIRKSIHLSCVVIPLSYLFIEREWVILLLGGAVLISVFFEAMRLKHEGFSRWVHGLIGRILRDHEKTRFTGSTCLLIGAFFTVLFFDKPIAISVLLFMIVADSAAALIGRFWGRRPLRGRKTVAGTSAFAVTSIIIVLLVPGVELLIGLVGVCAATIVEVFVQSIDDNLTIPLVAGGAMQLFSLILG